MRQCGNVSSSQADMRFSKLLLRKLSIEPHFAGHKFLI
jgi:hypothetical protein